MKSTIRYRILIALDRSEMSQIVLQHALDQALRHDAPDLHFLTVVEDLSASLELAKNWLGAEVVEALETIPPTGPDWRSRLHVRQGKPAEEIADLAGEIDADLIVVGRFGLHDKHGSTADRVLALAPCPMLVVGLTGHALGPQCDACVAMRLESDGERWFCKEHSDGDRRHLTTLVPMSMFLNHGGPLW